MKNISVILKNNTLIPVEEFRALDRYSNNGKILTLIEKPSYGFPFIIKQRVVEYVFDPESFLIFKIISTNILVFWDSKITENLSKTDLVQITSNFFVSTYPYLDS